MKEEEVRRDRNMVIFGKDRLSLILYWTGSGQRRLSLELLQTEDDRWQGCKEM